MPDFISIIVAVVITLIVTAVITHFVTVSNLKKNADSKIGNAESRASAVSYTHLDVYKRQMRLWEKEQW